VSSATTAATGTGSPRPQRPAAGASGLTRALAWAAAIGIGSSTLIMLGASVVRHSAAVPLMRWPPGWPPLELAGRLPVAATYAALWAAVILGGGGVIAGLAAVARGARFPARLLIAAAFVAVAAFAMLPPAGSTDTLNYAVFGRIAVLGHNPYVMTPTQLYRTGDPIGKLAPLIWHKHGTLYGPLATAEQRTAAELGGTSPARIIFWLKLWNAIVFLGVVIGLDRMLRSDPARRARAHLLWSLNPLVLWGLVASGHLDAFAVAASFFGLALVRTRRVERPGSPEPEIRGPEPLVALAAGALVGVAADFMLTYLLLAVALAWALRRWPAALLPHLLQGGHRLPWIRLAGIHARRRRCRGRASHRRRRAGGTEPVLLHHGGVHPADLKTAHAAFESHRPTSSSFISCISSCSRRVGGWPLIQLPGG